MTGNTPFDENHAKVDPSRTKPQNAFDAQDGYSGQEYSEARERDQAARAPAGEVDPHGDQAAGRSGDDGRDIPPDAGSRASFDPATGAVRGSGAGAGGGNQGEDYDASSKGGGGYPIHQRENDDPTSGSAG